MAERPEFIACSGPRHLPPHQVQDAAVLAWEHNPANRPLMPGAALAGMGLAMAPAVPMPALIAAMTTKYWGPQPRTLSVAFLEPARDDLAGRILDHMNAWADRGCCIRFKRSKGRKADVRITRDQEGYWSYLGTDICMIPATEPTMCLQAFSMDVPESEYRRVVRHEVGHCLGFPHEHMRAAEVARLDHDKTVALFARLYGWPPVVTEQQVFIPIDEASLIVVPAGSPTDETSIMCYQFDGSCTKDGRPIVGGTDINDADAKFAATIYPAKARKPQGT